jgi:hypothetical protein
MFVEWGFIKRQLVKFYNIERQLIKRQLVEYGGKLNVVYNTGPNSPLLGP